MTMLKTQEPSALRHYNTIVIGGGAAGLMCSAQLGALGLSCLVLDHANKVGKKILMSGGGRCNFTNLDIGPDHYISKNQHFCKSALSRYTQYDFLDLIHKHNIDYHEKTLGQLFCDHKSKDILNMLLAECDANGVVIQTSTDILAIKKLIKPSSDAPNSRFTLNTSKGQFQTSNIVLASGGLSIPTMGATGFGYEIAQQFGLKVTAKHASLVPFTLDQPYLTMAQQLAGLSIVASISCNNATFTNHILFTHKGLSGPAVLQISNYWWPEDTLTFNLLPQIDLDHLLSTAKINKEPKQLQTLLSEHAPKRFIQYWLEMHEAIAPLGKKTPGQLTHADIKQLCALFHQWTLTPKGTEGYKTAEVTRGGIDTAEVSSKTFETKRVLGLYCIGEVLDVTGWLGGYNFQWAWASGWCAAQAIYQAQQTSELDSDKI